MVADAGLGILQLSAGKQLDRTSRYGNFVLCLLLSGVLVDLSPILISFLPSSQQQSSFGTCAGLSDAWTYKLTIWVTCPW